ncbi:hypothetical protein DNTS_013402 [Danionella cerebrum]|uniref:Annexin n=1 Tax=Danionella cerebrum TaxID=2873325 RepID=A0A553PW92_9TELE|nr:hypothetical protein DNTS_013402 [Danionella translucida]TRY81959.1 hypothetical protein DNTS_013402 [Danionella translucida]
MSYVSAFLEQLSYLGDLEDQSKGQGSSEARGTVRSLPQLTPSSDAAILDKAIKAKGVDEATIIDTLVHRSNAQRQQIAAAYQQSFGKPLDVALKAALKGELEDVVLGLLMTPAKYDAFILKGAMKGLGTDEETLIEILASRTNKEINDIKQVFKQDYKKELEAEIKSETSGGFRDALLALCKATRSEDMVVRDDTADKDARALYEAGEKRKGTDHGVFIDILTSRNAAHLRKVFQLYNKYSKSDVAKAIDLEMKGDLERCLIAGSGYRGKILTRIIVSRSEIDLEKIKQEYQSKYSKSLYQDIQDDTKGDYETILLALCGN